MMLKELQAAKTGDSIQLCVSAKKVSDNATTAATRQLSELLALATHELKKWKDVMAVRMGYVFKDGWITTDRAIVVTVKKRKSLYELQKEGVSPLPDYFMGYPIENGWVASSYHIKVAVRDRHAIWLSSGNWQSSNQPELEKLEDVSASYLLHNYNREWHVIIENEELAQLYETFIQHDYNHNKTKAFTGKEVQTDLNFLIPSAAFEFTEELAPAYECFKPYAGNRVFTVTPLLTPDNFFEEVLELINCAKTELFIQNQTFNAPNPEQDKLEQLMLAILKKQQQGVHVKIIFRIINAAAARKNIEKLIEMGFDKNSIRLQKNCHNKGIIVDKQKVLVGSQNFSNDGISVNRDASLIFHDDKLAAYFRTIFLHDWHKIVKPHIGREAHSIELATDKLAIPAGMELMTWSEIKEMM